MQNKFCAEAVDPAMRRIRKNNKPKSLEKDWIRYKFATRVEYVFQRRTEAMKAFVFLSS